MINVLTMVFTQYLRTPFETFTDKYILARGIFMLLEKDGYDAKDYEEIKLIEKWTTQKLKVSLYKLDRDINPTKGDFKIVSKKFKYLKDTPEKPEITLTDNMIQHHLCVAIRRVHEIVMKVMKGYKLEQRLDVGEDEADGVEEFFEGNDGGTTQAQS